MDSEIVILSEVSQRQRQMSCYIAYMWNLKKKKKGTNKLIYKTEKESQMWKTNFLLPRGKLRRGG